MIRKLAPITFVRATFPLLLWVSGAAPALADANGLWLNPKHSVAVQTGACGPALCGRVVWASNHAQADAHDSGIPSLLGTQLLQNYRPQGRGVWRGTVYVPDMGRRFDSEIDEVSSTQIKVKGCILRGLVCRSQVWTRIGQLPS